MSTDARLERWTAPLPAPLADPRGHPSFDAIRTELAKLESPTGGAVDWIRVRRSSEGYLAEVGRDLVVGAALACALSEGEGLVGVALGARLVARLLDEPALTPPRPRARANAIATFAARAEIALAAARAPSRDGLEALASAWAALEVAARRVLGDDAPSTTTVQERARAALSALPAPVTAAPAPPPPPVFAPPPPLVSPAGASRTEPSPDRAEQVPAFVRRIAGQLVPAAALARARCALEPDAMRWTLAALYLPITSAPETTREARTALPAPPRLVLEALEKQSASAPPEIVVRDALGALERSRFALDLHAHLARALDRAGPSGAAAAAVHRHEVRGLLGRLPELLEREFADGTRFASATSRALFSSWEVPAAAASDESGVDPASEIRALGRAGKIADALALGARQRRSAESGRTRFELTLAMAQMAEDAGALPLALELHADLASELDRHALDAWDPELATRTLRASVRAHGAAAGTGSQALFGRLARLDAHAALEVSRALHATPARSGR